MSIPDIKSLSREEQLLAMEMLWNELCQNELELESPSWHKDVLKEREAMIAEGRARYITVEEMRKRART